MNRADLIATQSHGNLLRIVGTGMNLNGQNHLGTTIGGTATISWPRMIMLNLASPVRLLKKERDDARKTVLRIDRALKVLNGLGRAKGTGRAMSVQARKRIAAAQRKRWAKWKAAKGRK